MTKKTKIIASAVWQMKIMVNLVNDHNIKIATD